MTVYMTNREICLKAAERLREVGWRRGDFGGKDGPHCMLGACMWVTGYDDEEAYVTAAEAVDVAYSAYAHTPPSGPDAAIAWNDTPGRTVEEVIATLEACP